MTRYVHDDVQDAALDYIKQNCDLMVACEGFPATFTAATTTQKLADVATAASDFTISAGDTNGRKIRTAAKENVPVDVSGDFDHAAFVDTANSKLLYVTEGDLQAVILGNKVDFPEFDVEIADPIAEA